MSDPSAITLTLPYRLHVTHGAFTVGNTFLRGAVAAGENRPARVQVFVDQGVLNAWPGLTEKITTYAAAYADMMTLAGPVVAVPGGEACKNDRAAFDAVVGQMHDAKLCRQSFAVVIGGGAVLDVVGFAAAVVHRGVRLIRLPTTTLAQADSGVGVKNSINYFGKKNFLGTFAVPWAIINDEQFLTTLTDADWRCGFAEAVKVALVKDEPFFARIEAAADALRQRDMAVALPILRRTAELHSGHIVTGGDAFELTLARPLDFGHWAAHKLEAMTGFTLRHGEAVAVGIALDATYSRLRGMLDDAAAQRVLTCLTQLGLPIYHPAMADAATLFQGLEEFREHLGGRLTLTMLRQIGAGIDVHEIDRPKMLAALAELSLAPALRGEGKQPLGGAGEGSGATP